MSVDLYSSFYKLNLYVLLHFKGFVTSTRNEKDWARGKLFTWLNEDTVFSRPTYKCNSVNF